MHAQKFDNNKISLCSSYDVAELGVAEVSPSLRSLITKLTKKSCQALFSPTLSTQATLKN
jgi:hypothetical protein